jgi:acetyltransferase-like isoleucine patch superfamily enzyme
MQRRTERIKRLISAQNPLDMEQWVRALLIHYFFHVSDKARIEVFGEGPRLLNVCTPTVFKGEGRIRLATTACFGVARSPGSYSCSYVEARTPDSLIEIGPGTVFNNRAVLVSEGASIRFGANCLVGSDLHVMDSNGHDIDVAQRRQPDRSPLATQIGDDVFIGSRVTILKGASLGAGCVVSAGAVVPPRFQAAPFSVLAGNPARVVGTVRPANSL